MLNSALSLRHRLLAACALAALTGCGGNTSSDARGTHSADTVDGLHPLGYAYIPSEHSALPGNVVPGSNPPPAADVSQFSPPIGDQGQIGDCTTWAVGYGLASWLANSGGLNGGKNAFAPMFIFTHFAPPGSTDFGISTRGALDYLISSGIDTAADYDQNMPKTFSTTAGASIPGLGIDAASNDSTDAPVQQVLQNALAFKIGGYQLVFDTPPQSNPGVCPGYPGGSLPAKAAIASGSPVIVALPVPPEFDNYDGVHPVQPPTATETSRGGHAIMCTKYDANGLWCQNSWGTSWGAAGMVELSWAFVEQCVWEIDTALGIGGSQSSTQLAISITSPTNGQTVNGTVPVTILATPGASPLSGVSVQVGGAPVGDASSSGESFSYSLDTTQLPNGQQPISAIVTDQQGNTATDTVTVDVEN